MDDNGELNVVDIIIIINIILSGDDPSQGELLNGDVNLDGVLNILDVIRIVGMILDTDQE